MPDQPLSDPGTPEQPAQDGSFDREAVLAAPVCVIELDGPLRSKSNYRRTKAGSAKSADWARHREFEESLAVLARQARPIGWPLGQRDAALATRPEVVVLIVASSLLDTANMAKSVTDALEEVLFYNDASIRHIACVSTRSAKNQRASIYVTALEPGQPPAAHFAAANRLAELALAKQSQSSQPEDA